MERTAARKPHMPSDVTPHVGPFDRFASAVARFAAKAWFFALCVLLVAVWAPTILVIRNVDTWQLVINTATTIVTFLMVALLQNTETRNNEAVNDKLNAIADALADLMTALAPSRPELATDEDELRAAVGIEDRESA